MTTSPWLTEGNGPWPVPGGGLVLRHPDLGFLNGYVEVGPDHPWFGNHYDSIECEAHGGLTFSGNHFPARGFVPDQTLFARWVVGFDCGHAGDLVPRMPDLGGAYRDLAYVTAQVEALISQAQKAVAP